MSDELITARAVENMSASCGIMGLLADDVATRLRAHPGYEAHLWAGEVAELRLLAQSCERLRHAMEAVAEDLQTQENANAS